MKCPGSFRRHANLRTLGALVAAVCAGVGGMGLARAERGPHGFRQNGRQGPPVVVERRPPPPPPAAERPQANGFVPHSGQNQQHLAQWMQSHQGMPLEQQQRALEAEPGFRQLQPDVQQRMHDRLAQLNSMTPQQRQRAFARTEAMERLAPEQRQQVRSALSGLGALPEDRRRFVARTFRALRDLPEPQRQAYLNSPMMRGQFSEQERATLNNLFMVAPYLPPPNPVQPPR